MRLMRILLAAAIAAPVVPALAQSPISIEVVGRPGEEAAASAALVARHLARQLGVAEIRVENRTTRSAVDELVEFSGHAPKDGSVLLLTPPMTALMRALEAPGADYDAARFGWVGALSRAPLTLAASWVTGFKTLADGRRREMDVGALGDNSQSAWYPAIINSLTQTRFRVAPNYRSDKEVDAAIQNSEIGGRLVGWSTLVFGQSDLFKDKKLGFLTRIGGEGVAELNAAPAFAEAISNPRDREIAALVSIDPSHGRSLATPPGTPPEIVERYRKAFAAMAGDPAFVAEAAAAHIEMSPVDGAAVGKLVAEELAASPDVLARTRDAITGGVR